MALDQLMEEPYQQCFCCIITHTNIVVHYQKKNQVVLEYFIFFLTFLCFTRHKYMLHTKVFLKRKSWKSKKNNSSSTKASYPISCHIFLSFVSVILNNVKLYTRHTAAKHFQQMLFYHTTFNAVLNELLIAFLWSAILWLLLFLDHVCP